MSRKPIDARIDSGGEEAGGRHHAAPSDFKEAMARWAAGVCVVAVRDPDDDRVHATTVNSLAGISADPPRVAFSLGPGAQVLPFLDEGREFAVNILATSQRRLASRFTDPFPVGPSPFPDVGPPVIDGAHAQLVCRVSGVVEVEQARLVVGMVASTDTDDSEGPLLYYQRGYRTLE